MELWLICLIAGGAFILLMLIVVGYFRGKARKKKILKVKAQADASIKAEVKTEKPKEPKEEDLGLIFDEPKKTIIEEPNLDGVKYENYFDDDDDDFDDAELDEEVRRYREMMMKRDMPKQKKQLTDDEDFEKFRNEHCYSKYRVDKKLAEELKDLPEGVKSVILSNIFDRKEFDNIHFGDK